MAKMTKAERIAKRTALKAQAQQLAKTDAGRVQGESYIILPEGVERFKIKSEDATVTETFNIATFIAGYDTEFGGRPTTKGMTVYGRIYGRHHFNGKFYSCPKSIGLPCPLCEAEQKIKDVCKSKEDWAETKEERDVFRAKVRGLYYLIQGEKRLVYDESTHFFENKLRAEIDADPDFSDFQFLDEGTAVQVRYKKGAHEGHKFFEPERIDSKGRDDLDVPRLDEDEDIAKEAMILNDVLQFKSYDELKEIMMRGGEAETADDDSEEEDYNEDVQEDVPTRRTPAQKAEVVEDELLVDEKVEEKVDTSTGWKEEPEADEAW